MTDFGNNLLEICRLCAIESEKGMYIYSDEGEQYNLEQKILSCLHIEVTRDDLLPKKVCLECSSLLEQLHQFSLRACNAQQTLTYLVNFRMREMQQGISSLSNVKTENSLIKNELDELNTSLMNGTSSDFTDLAQLELSEVIHGTTSLETICVAEILPAQSEPYEDPIKKSSSRKKPSWDETLINSCNSSLSKIHEDGQNFGESVECNYDNKTIVDEEIEYGLDLNLKCVCGEIYDSRAQFEVHYVDRHHAAPTYECNLCDYFCGDFHEYFEHISQNHSYSCTFCGKAFKLIKGLRIHVKSKHHSDTAYLCTICRCQFDTKFRLIFHLKQCHTHKDKPTKYRLKYNVKQRIPMEEKDTYRCITCDKETKTRSGLVAHLLEHRMGRQYMCHICGKTFSQNINLKQHFKYHQEERPYTCDICQKSFMEVWHLKRHQNFHSVERPFQCKVCKKTYKTKRCLKVHGKVHEPARHHICNECGKGFTSSTKLKQHLHCHTGERPFACQYCERTFTNYPNWLKHTRRKHKVDHKTGLRLKEEPPGGVDAKQDDDDVIMPPPLLLAERNAALVPMAATDNTSFNVFSICDSFVDLAPQDSTIECIEVKDDGKDTTTGILSQFQDSTLYFPDNNCNSPNSIILTELTEQTLSF